MKKFYIIAAIIIGLILIMGAVFFVKPLTFGATVLYPTGGGTGTSTVPVKGSLLIGTGSVFAHLPVGTTNQFLVSSSTKLYGVDWLTLSGSGIFSINGLDTTIQLLAQVDDTNGTLAITSSVDTHTFTLGWQGTLAVSRGGTGWANINSGMIPFGNAGNALATSSALSFNTSASRFSTAFASTTAISGTNANFTNFYGALTGTASGNELPLTFNYPLTRATNAISTVATSSLGLLVESFLSPNISQWTNNSLYITQAIASTTFVDRADWTTINNYPATCTNQFVRALGDTNTCATVGAADVSLANLSATNGTLTFSGTYTGATDRTIGLNLGNANTWTALQTFGNATSTLLTFTTAWGALVGNSDTATALANNPTDCGAGTKAISIDASGNLTCSQVDISADTNLTAGVGLTLTGDDVFVNTNLRTKGWTHQINSTTTGVIIATTTGISAVQIPVASVITGAYGYCLETATTTVTAQIRANPKTAGSEVFNTAFAIGDNGSATTTFANTAIAAGSWVIVSTAGNGTGIPEHCRLSFKIIVDD